MVLWCPKDVTLCFRFMRKQTSGQIVIDKIIVINALLKTLMNTISPIKINTDLSKEMNTVYMDRKYNWNLRQQENYLKIINGFKVWKKQMLLKLKNLVLAE